MISENNIHAHELVGLYGTVDGSTNSQLVGMSGLIVDETQSMLIVQTDTGTKSIPKGINTWRFTVSGRDIMVHGNTIQRRSAQRLGVKI